MLHPVSHRVYVLPAVMLMGASLPAWAQDAASQPASTDNMAPDDGEFEFNLDAMAGVWIPSLSGEVKFGRSTQAGSLNVESFLDLDDNEASFATDLGMRINERWSVRLGAFDFDTDSTTTSTSAFLLNGNAIAAGSTLNNHFGLTSVTLHGHYDLFGNILADETARANSTGQGTPVDLRIAAVGGARALNVDHRLAVSGGPTGDFDEWLFGVEGGAKFSAIIGPGYGRQGTWDVSLALLGGIGAGGDADLGHFDLQFAIQYAVHDSFNLVFGYRQLDFDVDRDEVGSPYHYDGRLAGLFVGGTIRY